jgi:carbon-monoxide dehydrogenase medium subunit
MCLVVHRLQYLRIKDLQTRGEKPVTAMAAIRMLSRTTGPTYRPFTPQRFKAEGKEKERYPYLKRLPRFEYLAPRTVKDALSSLSRNEGKVKILGGGTDLLLKMKTREESPQYLVGLKNIPDLDYIHYDPVEGVRLGALVTVHEIETSALIRDKFPILAQAAATLGSVQVRNLATVVGNLCSALPSADMAPGLIVLGARLKIAAMKGERTIAVEDFFSAPGVSALAAGELVLEIQAPCHTT